MKPIPVTITAPQKQVRAQEPVGLGVPLPQGDIKNANKLSVTDANHHAIPCSIKATAYWPDNSIRWLLVDFPADTKPNIESQYFIEQSQQNTATQIHTTHHTTAHNAEGKTDAQKTVTIKTASHTFSINTEGAFVLQESDSKNQVTVSLTDANSRTYQPLVHATQTVYPSDSYKQQVVQTGAFKDQANNRLCDFSSTLTFYANSNHVKWDFSIHNTGAAKHQGGLWDLGDEGSVLFESLTVAIKTTDKITTHSRLQTNAQSEWLTANKSINLYQGSSGGKNWQSNNHINSSGKKPLTQKGFVCSIDDIDTSSHRADPIIFSDAGISVYVENFWQNFPKAFSANNDNLFIELFPKQFLDVFELQGGEKKTHTLYLDFSGNPDALDWARQPLLPQLSLDYYANTDTLFHFSTTPEPIDAIINKGLCETNGFMAKRELTDEYGWRNFGDIVADHESLYLPDDEMFISHYNNQYDPLYGFIRQYIYTGNAQWMTLASDLARHISDIDLYDTIEDRAEYNGGLFWHTDHYVDALTSSHRTYSKHQIIDGAPTQGGGPGGEHCYTRGLLLHHYLTGSEQSKASVLKLTQWITHFYEGSGTVLEYLIALNKPSVHLPVPPGSHKYPLNRGVGNYIRALLDSFTLTDDKKYLTLTESVIRGTIHPKDSLHERNLGNVEDTWFYTIFLQAVIHYLAVKGEQQKTHDEHYLYAVSALLHYSRWIRDHETLALDNPEKLDYPNDTWAAQEIRKATILSYSATICQDDERKAYQERADFFYNAVTQQLQHSETSHFSRILAILMQNHGSSNHDNKIIQPVIVPDEFIRNLSPPYITKTQQITKIFFNLVKKILTLSPKAELSWLQHRNATAKKLFNAIIK